MLFTLQVDLKKHIIKVHGMEDKCILRKQRKLRKDRGKPKLGTAGKLIGINVIANKRQFENKDETNSVRDYFQNIISTFHDEVAYNC